jgi:Fe-S-cluster-containing dehydrogenase component/DMSO reductase anchor subunit
MAPQFVEPKTLIDELLAQQKSLGSPGSSLASSAVERFSDIHDQQTLPAQARYYRDLIPLNKPAPGEQYAFEVDLDKCSGCKACVTACHSLNGLDEGEVWRSVGALHGLIDDKPFQRNVTTACHHCVEPGCLEGCPVLAYEKDPITGIVKHLDDQCIGCSYCILKCPYDVPKYSEKRGIVRKCDMCSSRLASGEAPACVQACPNEAIRIALVDCEEVSRAFAGRGAQQDRRGASPTRNDFLPDSPDPNFTRPTTKYRSAEPLHSNLRGADHAEIKPSKAHPSLVLFLVLTQLSVGGFTLAMLMGRLDRANTAISLVAGLAGLVLSVTHLGKPLKAWRSFLGLRTSWLSREIVAFGVFAPLAMLLTLSFWLPGTALLRLQQLMAVSVSLTGMSGVLCSVMVYHDTRREFWRWPVATEKFLGTTLLLGAALLNLPWLVAITAALKFAFELGAAFLWSAQTCLRFKRGDVSPRSDSSSPWSEGELRGSTPRRVSAFKAATRRRTPNSELARTSHLLAHDLKPIYFLQLATLFLGGILLPFVNPIFAFAACLVSELLERHLFFVAVSPDRMPGSAK